MKSLIVAVAMAVACIGMAPLDAAAKRLGGGGSSGMQRSLPSRTAPQTPPPKPAEAAPTRPAAPAAVPAAVAPKRSWMGPLAGLAAGLGIAALMSHFGMGEGLGNFLTLALMALAAFVVIRFLMRRFGPSSAQASTGMGNFAAAGAPMAPTANRAAEPWQQPASVRPASVIPAAGAATGAASASGPALPPDFDTPAFERIAKMIFIRLQAANDSNDLADLRAFTTPEMFAAIKLDLQERGSALQQTDVVKVDTEVLDVATEAGRQIVSVRFHGLVREERDAAPTAFDEVWHVVKPVDGSREWAIAGIQQTA